MFDYQELVGAYVFNHALYMALLEAEDLDRYSNYEAHYHNEVAPILEIVEESEQGGAKRFTARERFRQAIEERTYFEATDELFEDVAAGDTWMLVEGEEFLWELFHRGPAIMCGEALRSAENYLTALMKDPKQDLIVYVEHRFGYIYVLRSAHTQHGRYHQQHGGMGIHLFDHTVVFNEDHEQYHNDTSYCLPPDILELADEIKRKEEEARHAMRQL